MPPKKAKTESRQPRAKAKSQPLTKASGKPAKNVKEPAAVRGKTARASLAGKAKGPTSVRGRASQTSAAKIKKVSSAVGAEIFRELCQRYPDADCELKYHNAFELLISVILSAQTTDANVNRVTPGLFKRFPTARALADAPIDEIKELIRSTGYYNAKAANIQACARGLMERFKGEVPDNLPDLTTLPGVGRKTANVVLGVIFKQPGWTVDTHVQRLSHRLGLSAQTDPAKIETDLQKLFPGQDWTKYSITLIWHGRRCCDARKPDCTACPVNHLCPSSQV